jgi:P27 family predicted phage terminase small subunit
MALKGRTPKPTALKIKQGNPGKRALNRTEPQTPRDEALRAPDYLSGAARREWLRLRKRLVPAGLLTPLDADILALYCQAHTRWVEAEEHVQRIGPVVKTKSGNLVPNPYLAIANRAMDQMLVYARELGMTPSARSRIQVAPVQTGPSLAEELFRAASQMQRDEDE